MIYNKVSNKIKTYIWKWKHEKRNIENRKRLKNKEISIISTNCIGGVLSHDLGLQFKSPTVNLFFRAEDFIKFCENLEYYNFDFLMYFVFMVQLFLFRKSGLVFKSIWKFYSVFIISMYRSFWNYFLSKQSRLWWLGITWKELANFLWITSIDY